MSPIPKRDYDRRLLLDDWVAQQLVEVNDGRAAGHLDGDAIADLSESHNRHAKRKLEVGAHLSHARIFHARPQLAVVLPPSRMLAAAGDEAGRAQVRRRPVDDVRLSFQSRDICRHPITLTGSPNPVGMSWSSPCSITFVVPSGLTS